MSSKLFPHLFSPGKIGTLELKNRVMKAPQSSGMSNMDGTVSERLVRYYRKQAAGGAGMIMTPQPVCDCIKSVDPDHEARRIYLSPRGKLLTADIAKKTCG